MADDPLTAEIMARLAALEQRIREHNAVMFPTVQLYGEAWEAWLCINHHQEPEHGFWITSVALSDH